MGIKMDEYELLDKDTGPYGITAGKDGALWFTQHKANQIVIKLGALPCKEKLRNIQFLHKMRSHMELHQVLMVLH
ncbi:hypothetical protein [Peribacillus frigoritolerans]|uniref:hypothetical protein n=1 Tax=Peribacillus frigoritolerans TaxID=450367 RepID=UPI00215AF0F7|nr:hypothetical protein [Peribacillus frigoritolerans]MCR8869533.1 hypothetical protein [Peribacillus frigoritolerans]